MRPCLPGRYRNACRNNRRVKVNVAARACGLCFDARHFQRTGHPLFAIVRPWLGRVIHRIARLCELQNVIPVEWLLRQALAQVFEQEVVIGFLPLLIAYRQERLVRTHHPANGLTFPLRVHKVKGVNAVKRRAREAAGGGFLCRPFKVFLRLRVRF